MFELEFAILDGRHADLEVGEGRRAASSISAGKREGRAAHAGSPCHDVAARAWVEVVEEFVACRRAAGR